MCKQQQIRLRTGEVPNGIAKLIVLRSACLSMRHVARESGLRCTGDHAKSNQLALQPIRGGSSFLSAWRAKYACSEAYANYPKEDQDVVPVGAKQGES